MVNTIFAKAKRITKLDIVKVFSFTSISTLVKMIAGFISIKVVAVLIGPAGVALVGQLKNFAAIIMAIATGGITTGVTKYIAQYKGDSVLVKNYVGTAVKITLVFSAACGLFLILGAPVLSVKILLDTKYYFVFIVFGVTLIFYTANTLLLAIINGYKQFTLYVKISIVSSIVGLGVSLLLVIPFGVSGALLNAVTSQSLVFACALVIVKKTKLSCISKNYIWNRFDKVKARQLFRFAFMSLISAFTVPISQLVIRSYIVDRFSIQVAGRWEGLNQLSGMYLMIITSSFSVYYLPKLSELTHRADIKREIKNAYKVIIPCLLVGLTGVYFGRFIIIRVLFSPEFYEMSGLFFWRLVGDFLKIASWLIAFLMHAKAMMKLFITTEILFNTLYVGLVFILSKWIGLAGVVLGYAVNYGVYLGMVWILVYQKKH
jgi:PST family polysaccharide transporter